MTTTLSIEIEICDDADEQFYDQLCTTAEDVLQTIVDKNSDYGDIRQTARHNAAMGVYETPTEAFVYEQWMHITNKYRRFGNLVFGDTERSVSEVPFETAMDTTAYWLFMSWCGKFGVGTEGHHGSPWADDRSEYRDDDDEPIDDVDTASKEDIEEVLEYDDDDEIIDDDEPSGYVMCGDGSGGHDLHNTFTVNTKEGGITLKEWECGLKYVLTGKDANYCPECGDSL